MPITKQYLKSKPECKVTFTVPAVEADKVEVAGDFNSWNLSELKKYKNGNFKAQFNVPVDQTYQFRYVIDGKWMNEEEADGYQWSDFAAADNSLLKV
ncbi:isoamylase early set domain-containing protein [Christiangramia sabulilitoris]|uniref:Glycoside hydrolase n=1 Tax=Christiangramia sabulilitoris TaxID=2583991 RepID=A0A550HZH3_9FLAO|nr:isoamylase early set domain-containing protein [Christiangramia sabulilitoris]TRO64133.1 glycoside hydrolase [Christiangramia sabulilitoris]